MKDKLITRLDKIVGELIVLGEGFHTFLTSIPKEPTKAQTLQQGFNTQQLAYKGIEFSLLATILIEDFNVDFNTEVPERVKQVYFDSIKKLEELKKTQVLPEELKKFLASSGK